MGRVLVAKNVEKKTKSLAPSRGKSGGKFIHWEPLNPGDKVSVIAPASACKKEDLDRALRVLKAWELEPIVPKPLFGQDILCSNTDEVRSRHLKQALYHKESKAIFCVRGGYGCNRLLSEIQKIKRPKNPKLIIGYSDVSSLHYFVNQSWNWPSLHGPVLETLGGENLRSMDEALLKKILFGQKSEVQIKGLRALNQAAKLNRTINSALIGGNLMVLQSFLGTPWQYSMKGRILFLEEVNERGYRVDRALWQMQQAGFFKGLKALVLGDFVGGKEASGRQAWRSVLRRFANESNFPVLAGVPAGHGEKKVSLPFMTFCSLELGSLPRLNISTGCKKGF